MNVSFLLVFLIISYFYNDNIIDVFMTTRKLEREQARLEKNKKVFS